MRNDRDPQFLAMMACVIIGGSSRTPAEGIEKAKQVMELAEAEYKADHGPESEA